MDKIMSNKAVIALFVVPGLLIFSFVLVYPILYTVNLSFTSWGGIGAKEYVGLDNFVKLLTNDTVFVKALKNTGIILVTAVIGQLVPALFFAILLSFTQKRTRFFRTAFFIPVLLSTTAIALMWQKIYDVNYGLLNEVLNRIHLSGWTRDWLTDEKTCLIAAVVPVVWQWIGYHMIIMYAGLKAIPEQYTEAARLDGANYFQVTVKILLPMLRDIVKVCLVLAVVGSIKIFDNIYVMTGGGPYNLTTTIAIQMYKESFLKFNYGYGSAIAVVLCILCIGIYLLLNKLLTKEAVEY